MWRLDRYQFPEGRGMRFEIEADSKVFAEKFRGPDRPGRDRAVNWSTPLRSQRFFEVATQLLGLQHQGFSVTEVTDGELVSKQKLPEADDNVEVVSVADTERTLAVTWQQDVEAAGKYEAGVLFADLEDHELTRLYALMAHTGTVAVREALPEIQVNIDRFLRSD